MPGPLANWLADQIAAGRWRSQNDAIAEALDLLRRREARRGRPPERK